MTGKVPWSERASRLASPSSAPSGPHSRASSAASAAAASTSSRSERRRAAQRGRLERGHERVPDRGAGLEPAGQRDDRHAVGASALRELAAGRRHQARGAGGLCRVVGRQRLLGAPRVARAQHQRLAADPGRDVVAHRERERAAQPRAERAGGQPPADRRAAHAGDDQPARRVDRRDRGRVDAPERIAQVLGQAERLADLAGRVDLPACGCVERRHLRTGALRRGSSRRGRCARRSRRRCRRRS